MLSRAMTRRILMRSFVGGGLTSRSDSGNDRLGRQLEPGRQVDLRLVAEDLARGGDVRPRVANVSRPRRLEALLDGLAENATDRLRNVVDARRRAGGDVERAPVRAGRLRRADRRVDAVRDVGEVPRLLAVAVDRARLARAGRPAGKRDPRRGLWLRGPSWAPSACG